MFYLKNDDQGNLMARIKRIEAAAGEDAWTQVMVDRRRGGELNSVKIVITYNPGQQKRRNGNGKVDK